eukprot:3752564-Rhodomonas_salina.2
MIIRTALRGVAGTAVRYLSTALRYVAGTAIRYLSTAKQELSTALRRAYAVSVLHIVVVPSSVPHHTITRTKHRVASVSAGHRVASA